MAGSQRSVVVANNRDVPWNAQPFASEHFEDTDSCQVVCYEHGGGTGSVDEEAPHTGAATLLGEATLHCANLGFESVILHGTLVSSSPWLGTRTDTAVDMGDTAVSKINEVVDDHRRTEAVIVGDAVNGWGSCGLPDDDRWHRSGRADGAVPGNDR